MDVVFWWEVFEWVLAAFLVFLGVRAFFRYGAKAYREDALSGNFRPYKGKALERIKAEAERLKSEVSDTEAGGPMKESKRSD